MKNLLTHDLDAHHYEKNSFTQYENVKNILKSAVVKDEASILDVGCGYGKVISELSKKIPNGSAVGVDPSPNMIKLAAERFPESIFPNLEFHQIKAEEMCFKPSSFDLIICTNALIWVRSPKKALVLMSKFLKKDGEIIIFTFSNDTPYASIFEETLRKFFPDYVDVAAFKTMLSSEEHRKILMSHGVEIKSFKLDDIFFTYSSEVEFKDYINGWLPCYVSMPADIQDEFLNRIVEVSRHHNISKVENEIVIPHRSLTIIGRKL